MREIRDDAELKGVLLDALSAFARFCDEQGLRYYLVGGTLLGAVRHHGFIPWDDDIDVGLPRSDYERFIKLAGNGIGDRYAVSSYVTDARHIYPFAKMYDTRTYLVEERHIPTKNSGVFIDVFPVDGIPEDPAAYASHVNRIKRLRTLAGYAGTSKFAGKSYMRTIMRSVLVTVCKAFGSRFFLSRIDSLAKKFEFDACNHVAVVVWGYGTKERMDKASFVPRIEIPFEERLFSASAGYDAYLSGLYGDYMTPPPKEEQQGRHEFRAYWRDEGEN